MQSNCSSLKASSLYYSCITNEWHWHILKVLLDIHDSRDPHIVDGMGGNQEIGGWSQYLIFLIPYVLSYGQATEGVARVIVVTGLPGLVNQSSAWILISCQYYNNIMQSARNKG